MPEPQGAHEGRRWGAESAALCLPGCPVVFDGLSALQRARIAERLGAFLAGAAVAPAVVCEARPLPSAPTLSAQALTHRGQYAPRVERQGDALAVTGLNFTARIPLAEAPATAWLAADEAELPRPFVLDNFLRILLAHRALGFGGMLLHSAGVVIGGSAFLFVGPSNAGKTTLSRKADGEDLAVLSDDINLVLPAAGDFAVHSVPFTGEFCRRVQVGPGAHSLAGLLLLEKGPRLGLAQIGPAAAVSALFAQSPFVNTGIEAASGLLESLAGLVAKVPVARLTVALESPFSEVVKAVEEHFAYV